MCHLHRGSGDQRVGVLAPPAAHALLEHHRRSAHLGTARVRARARVRVRVRVRVKVRVRVRARVRVRRETSSWA